jgi:hypothetical protein
VVHRPWPAERQSVTAGQALVRPSGRLRSRLRLRRAMGRDCRRHPRRPRCRKGFSPRSARTPRRGGNGLRCAPVGKHLGRGPTNKRRATFGPRYSAFRPPSPRGSGNITPSRGPVGPAETKHIENITDWYVENRIIPNRPEIAPFVTDLSRR